MSRSMTEMQGEPDIVSRETRQKFSALASSLDSLLCFFKSVFDVTTAINDNCDPFQNIWFSSIASK